MQESDSPRVERQAVVSGFDGTTCWVQARAGAIPGDPPTLVLTMQKLLLAGSDVFYALNEMRSEDGGRSWTGPVEHTEDLGRRPEPDGVVSCICDGTPTWHEATGRLLLTGHVASYIGDALMPGPRPRQTAYSVYDADRRTWTRWDTVVMPDRPEFFSAGAGCTQRVDLPGGEILLPLYFMAAGEACYRTAVMRCRFDGRTLSYVEHGDELAVEQPRGLCEPSLARFGGRLSGGGRFYLTLRNDERGYVTSGDDGLHFDPVRPWTFDDGEELGSYNTQQHWLTCGDGLYLVYTRRGLGNDHVFRHRAPLVMGRVDPERLCVLRSTERVLVPERGARLGNFGVCRLGGHESLVVAAEWMQPVGCERYGGDNTVWAVRVSC